MSSAATVRHISVRTSVVLLRDGREVARWPLELWASPDVAVVDDLARLQLAARRVGMAVRLSSVPPELARILDLVGAREWVDDVTVQ